MSHSRGSWRKHRSDRRGDRGKFISKEHQKIDTGNAESAILKSFSSYAAELDTKHDRYERIVKISRDITIESKRIIFLLHTIDKESKKAAVLEEAEKRLQNVVATFFKSIAKELVGEDQYLYLRAFTAGLQEYVEAFTFYFYLKCNKLEPWSSIQDKLTYTLTDDDVPKDDLLKDDVLKDDVLKDDVLKDDVPKDDVPKDDAPKDDAPKDDAPKDDAPKDDAPKDDVPKDEVTNEGEVKEESGSQIVTVAPPFDYVLGVGDLTGELMRHCINNLGCGQLESCMQTCVFVRKIYNGFLGVGNTVPKEFYRKLYTLRQSLSKIENACYAIHVRGSEIPKNMLADVLRDTALSSDVYEEDEGFY